jgi:hypothetical protein
LIVPDDGSVEFAKPFGVHHYTIYYGSPESILGLVADVVAIPDPPER